MERADIAILGTGPAGISAAITAKVRNKKIILIGYSDISDKVSKAHQIMNYPGLPGVSGADMSEKFKMHLNSMNIGITKKKVNAVYAMGDYFGIQTTDEMPCEIFGDKKVEGLKTEKNQYDVDGIFILRDAVSPEQLVPGLLMDGKHVKVNLQMETNIPGCFACGDIAGKPYQYIKASGQGNVAALSAVSYIDIRK